MSGKWRWVRAFEVPATVVYSESNPLHGSAIAEHSIPPSRIICDSLSALSANLGRVTAGTMSVGRQAGSRVVLGDDVDGLAAYDDEGRQVLSFITRRGGRFRLGAEGTPSIIMSGGTIVADGDIIAVGSMRANRLIVGSMAGTLLESDRLQDGTGDCDAGTFSGFAAINTVIGGYSNGTEVWTIDRYTGQLVMRDTTYPYDIYSQLGGRLLEFSNISQYGTIDTRSGVYFHSVASEFEPGDPERVSSLFMDSNARDLRLTGDTVSSVILRNENQEYSRWEYNGSSYINVDVDRQMFVRTRTVGTGNDAYRAALWEHYRVARMAYCPILSYATRRRTSTHRYTLRGQSRWPANWPRQAIRWKATRYCGRTRRRAMLSVR